jgi:anti-sigma regulatory factor (Ser/Thr protein kinase)
VPAVSTRFDRMVPAAPGSIGPLRRQLRAFARRHGASGRVQAAVALAFSEACAVVVRASDCREAEPPPLIVEASVRDAELRVRVAHQGRAVTLASDLSGYGFGLALISRVADSFEVARRDDGPGTALTMVFSLERSRARASSAPGPRD